MQSLKSLNYTIEFGDNSLSQLNLFLKKENYSSYYILCDENTFKHCLPTLMATCTILNGSEIIEIESGEHSKSLDIATHIWQTLIDNKTDKNALIINLGGGVVSDLGGFVASLYKRGINYINIPTSLLAMADASIGGKTGVDFAGIKNSIGTITQPKGVFINYDFLLTLPQRHINNGLAEVYKMAIMSDAVYWKKISHPKFLIDYKLCVTKSVTLKNKFVKKDPLEKNSRKALNFGHTVGHAVESVLLGTPKELLHGEAIIIGMVCEAWISYQKKLLAKTELNEIVFFLKSHIKPISEVLFLNIINDILQDKKNDKQNIRCVLLNGIGSYKIDVIVTPNLILKSLHFCNSIL